MTDVPETIAFGRRIRVTRWLDAAGEGSGHDARSKYVERYWLPILGPSTTSFEPQELLGLGPGKALQSGFERVQHVERCEPPGQALQDTA